MAESKEVVFELEWREQEPFYGERWWHLMASGHQVGSLNEACGPDGNTYYRWHCGTLSHCCRTTGHGIIDSKAEAMKTVEDAALKMLAEFPYVAGA